VTSVMGLLGVCRLDAVRAARIRNNPKEEQALLDRAREVASSAAAQPVAPSNGEAAADGGPAQESKRGQGRGQASRCDTFYTWMGRDS